METFDILFEEEFMSSLTEVLYQQMYEDLLMLRLKPGQRLHIADLAKHYKTGLSPVREALSRLTSTELVIAIPQKGFRVAEISLKDLEDIYETRILIEEMALRLSIEKGDEGWEANILAAYHRLEQYEQKHEFKTEDEYREWEARHRAFNLSLISSCGLSHLLRVQEKLYYQTERYRRLWVLDSLKESPNLIFAQKQKQIMRATIERDTPKALELLRKHYEQAQKSIANFLKDSAYI